MKRKLIRKIERAEIEPNPLYGFVVDKSASLLMLAVEDDFILDGYQVVRKEDITSNKVAASSRHHTSIMKKEGILDGVTPPNVILESWRDVFRSLKQLDQYVIVEDEINEEFLIGPIVRVSAKSVSIRHFDSTGEWVDMFRIVYDDITTVRWGCRYVSYHQKYVKNIGQVNFNLKDK